MKMMILGVLYNELNGMVMLATLGVIIQSVVGVMLVLFLVTKEMLLQCIEENEDVIIQNIMSFPISESLKEQLGEQMHCIARYYRNTDKR